MGLPLKSKPLFGDFSDDFQTRLKQRSQGRILSSADSCQGICLAMAK